MLLSKGTKELIATPTEIILETELKSFETNKNIPSILYRFWFHFWFHCKKGRWNDLKTHAFWECFFQHTEVGWGSESIYAQWWLSPQVGPERKKPPTASCPALQRFPRSWIWNPWCVHAAFAEGCEESGWTPGGGGGGPGEVMSFRVDCAGKWLCQEWINYYLLNIRRKRNRIIIYQSYIIISWIFFWGSSWMKQPVESTTSKTFHSSRIASHFHSWVFASRAMQRVWSATNVGGKEASNKSTTCLFFFHVKKFQKVTNIRDFSTGNVFFHTRHGWTWPTEKIFLKICQKNPIFMKPKWMKPAVGSCWRS